MTAIKLAIYIGITSMMTWGLVTVDAFEVIYTASRAHENWELDEIIIGGIVAMLTGTVWLSIELSKSKIAKARAMQVELSNRFDVITQSVSLPIFIVGRDSDKIEYINEAGCNLLGCGSCKVEDIADTHFFDDQDVYRGILERLDRDAPVENYEFRFRTVDGTTVPALLSCREIVVDGNSSLAMVIVDLSELNASQALLVHASKLATLGEMAAGIAHELKQPLNNIRMAAEILNECGVESDTLTDADQLLANIMSQVDRAAAIIDHMGMFARNDVSVGKIDLVKAVDGALSLVTGQIRLMDIDIVRAVPDTVRPIKGDGLQLEQVVVNLLTNARDAIAERNDENGKQSSYIRVMIEDNLASDTVNIVIANNGVSIPENVLERMFEPFFTTKEVGKGTGIGLSISNSIIISMGGTILAENTEDGAQFTIALPAMIDEVGARA